MKDKKKITVIGDGGWGTALGLIGFENGHDVTIWGPFADYIETIKANRENISFLKGVTIPHGVNLTADRVEALKDTDAVILAVPTKYYSDVVASMAGLIPENASVVSVAKGLDRETHQRMSSIAEELLHHKPIAALSGPSHAEEVARGVPTAVTVACENKVCSECFQQLLSNSHFRVYTSQDVVGVELGGALKNVLAIAVGISDGLGFGDNTRAALISRGLVEMTRLGMALGAEEKTFTGLSGLGDLIVTCTSKLSRNRAVGERIGRGEKVTDILSDMQQAVEGVWNCASAQSVADKYHIDAPITNEVFAIIHENKDPLDALKSLLTRDVKPE
jgi:glycerol-3-phosphate dehydrogenase (NAD(P)+)